MKRRTWLKLLLITAFSMGCLATTPGMAQGLFLDPQFNVKVTDGIVYGTAPILTPPGDFDLLLDLYEPVGSDVPSVRPGVVLIHGGGFTGGSRKLPSVVTLANEMAARGYTAVSIDYRLQSQTPELTAEFTPYYMAMMQQGYQPLGARAVAAAAEDATRAHRWMVEHAGRLDVDIHRIAVGGESAGAITALGLGYVLDDHRVANVPEIGVILDKSGTINGFLDCMESSEPALFIAHGGQDQLFNLSLAAAIARKAARVGIPFEFHSVPGAGHGFNMFTSVVRPGVTVFDRVVRFFYEELRLEDLILDATIQALTDAENAVIDLHPSDWRNIRLRGALVDKIDAVFQWIDLGLYENAQRQLSTDILRKMDGCAASGFPDVDDWIITCAGQDQVHPLISTAIDLLGDLIASSS